MNTLKKMLKDNILKPGIEQDTESYKVRRGKIGGYIDYLSKQDLVYIDEVVREMVISGCSWYYAT